jgi:hypothetical protein
VGLGTGSIAKFFALMEKSFQSTVYIGRSVE